MGKFSATKIFCLVVLILFMQASGMRVSTRQEQAEGAAQPAEVSTNEAAEGIPSGAELIEGRTFFATPESLEFYRSGLGRLEDRLNEDGVVYSRAVCSHRDNHCRFEVTEDNLDNHRPRDRADNECHHVCDRFSFTELDVFIFEDAFFIVRNNDEPMTAHHELFEMLHDRYHDINNLFHIENDLPVAHYSTEYFLTDDRRNIESRNFHIALTSQRGYYLVEAMRINIRTILIRVPRNMQFGPYVSYQ